MMVVNDPGEFRNGMGALQRSIRLVLLLYASENAGLTPIPILHLHNLAYLSNVLSPVWKMPTLDGKILKRHGGPFYPSLQHDLDRLVGTGVVLISGISHVLNEEQRWRLEGTYILNQSFAGRILTFIKESESDSRLLAFLQELAYALSALSDNDLERATTEDATYSDPIIDTGNVIDFGEWRNVNYSSNAARHFEQLIPGGGRATRGEMLHLYVHHLHRRLYGGR